jgi:tripartite-type tricarboxylate transporter receptor subunit TctC
VIVASPSFPASSLAELIAYARANPEKLSYATPGVGTVAHMAAEMLSSEAGVRMTHIPYKGAQLALADLLSGAVPVSFESSFATTAPSIKAGKLKAIAITRKSRTPLMPDVPTVAESGYPGFDISAWFGLVGPAGLSADITAKLADAINKGLRSKEIIDRLAVIGAEPQAMTPEQFSTYIRAELARWAKVVKASGAKAE